MKFKILLLTGLLLTLTACGSIPTLRDMQATAVAGTLEAIHAQTETANQIQTAVAATVAAQGGAPVEAATTLPGEATPDPGATPTPTPGDPATDPTATPARQELVLGDVGFTQEERRVSLGFFVRNPNPELTITGAEYTVTVLDSSGKILYLQNNVLPTLLPEYGPGIALNINLPEDGTADSVTIELEGGTASQTGPLAPLIGRNAVIWADDDNVQVAAEFDNPHPFFIEDITASVILFDAEGRVVGGGVRFWNYVRGNDSNAVTVPVSGATTAVRAELYPLVYQVPTPVAENEWPDGAVLPVVISADFAQEDEQRWLYAVEIRNPNPGHAIPQTLFTVVGFAPDGAVRFVEATWMDTLGPGMSSILGNSAFLNGEGEGLSRIEVNLSESMDFEVSGAIPAITFENIQIEDDGIGYTFVADLVNPHPIDLENAWVHIVVRDENGVLIYVNREPVNLVPAGQTLVIDHWAPQLEIEPASVEMYLLVPVYDELIE
jgi:hypothetical protein